MLQQRASMTSQKRRQDPSHPTVIVIATQAKRVDKKKTTNDSVHNARDKSLLFRLYPATILAVSRHSS